MIWHVTILGTPFDEGYTCSYEDEGEARSAAASFISQGAYRVSVWAS